MFAPIFVAGPENASDSNGFRLAYLLVFRRPLIVDDESLRFWISIRADREDSTSTAAFLETESKRPRNS